MSDSFEGEGFRERMTRSGEDTLGKLAQDLLDNPVVNAAISRAMEARERAAQVQEVAMGALNIPSASDMERLTRRVRSVSQRLEGIEDGVDRVDERLAALARPGAVEERLTAIEEQLDTIVKEIGAIQRALPAQEAPVSRDQESLRVGASE